MPILFSAIASDKIVLAKFASCEGNFSEIADAVLSKVPAKNEKVTYFHGHYLFHYVTDNDRLYFCITDKTATDIMNFETCSGNVCKEGYSNALILKLPITPFMYNLILNHVSEKTCQRSRAFLFLNQIRRRFDSEGKVGLTRALADEMYRYSEDYSTIVIHAGELDELNRIGVRSSEEILGEKILLVKNINNLSYSTITTVGKTPEEAVIFNNNIKTIAKDLTNEVNNIETTKVHAGIPLSTNEAEICTATNEIIDSKEKSKSHIKIVIAMFLIGLAIYIFDFMPFGQVVVLVTFVIFVLLRQRKD